MQYMPNNIKNNNLQAKVTNKLKRTHAVTKSNQKRHWKTQTYTKGHTDSKKTFFHGFKFKTNRKYSRLWPTAIYTEIKKAQTYTTRHKRTQTDTSGNQWSSADTERTQSGHRADTLKLPFKNDLSAPPSRLTDTLPGNNERTQSGHRAHTERTISRWRCSETCPLVFVLAFKNSKHAQTTTLDQEASSWANNRVWFG